MLSADTYIIVKAWLRLSVFNNAQRGQGDYKMNRLTIDQITKEFGAEILGKIEQSVDGYSPTDRLLPDPQNDAEAEFCAYVEAKDKEGNLYLVQAYVYQDKEEIRECDDLGNYSWEPKEFEATIIQYAD